MRVYKVYRLCRILGKIPSEVADMPSSWFEAISICDAAERDAFLEHIGSILKAQDELNEKVFKILLRLCVYLAMRL